MTNPHAITSHAAFVAGELATMLQAIHSGRYAVKADCQWIDTQADVNKLLEEVGETLYTSLCTLESAIYIPETP